MHAMLSQPAQALVPTRPSITLCYALLASQVYAAEAIVIGINAVDYSGDPDCHAAFIDVFANMARMAT